MSSSFRVQIRIGPSSSYREPVSFTTDGPVTPVEIIKLPVVSTLAKLLSEAYAACKSTLGNEKHNDVALYRETAFLPFRVPIDKFVRIAVEWQADPQRRETWTEVHDGNVVAVLERLSVREGCADFVVLLY